MTDDDLRDRLTDVVQRAFRWRQDADTVAAAVLPLVRDEIAAAEHRGAERAAQAFADSWHAVQCARLARAAVPAPTGDNA